MKKAVIGVLLAASLMLSGCSMTSPSEDIVKNTKAFTQEEIKANQTGVIGAEQVNIVYQYVSNSVQIDKDKLIAVDISDATMIKDKVAEINEALRTGETVIKAEKDPDIAVSENAGKIENEVADVNQPADKVIISDSIANYMLHHFAKTPYTWKMDDCKIVGMDSATHLYFVDVYYSTTSEKKKVLPETKLTLGMDNYDIYALQRYQDYINAMTALEAKDDTAYKPLIKTFTERWGSLDSVVKNLEFDSPLKYAAKYGKSHTGIGSYAYADSTNTYDITGAKVVYRMVMGYNYNVSDQVIIEPKAVYAYNYSVDNKDAILDNVTTEGINASEIINPLINRVIYSYTKAMDEADHNGLYKMFKSYKKYDTDVQMFNMYTYHNFGNYIYDIVGRKNDKIYVEVISDNKERTKGSAMSEANYKDTKLFTFSIDEDDNIKIIDVLDLARDIVGEPLSVIQKVSGVQDQINYSESAFTESNRQAVENTIKEFMKLELTQTFNSDVFKNCIDLGINASELDNIKKTLNSISANEVITWVEGYNTKSNLYVNVALREIYSNSEKHTAYETTSNIGLINRNGKWFVVSYTRTMNVKLQSNKYSDIDAIEHFVLKDGEVKSIKKEIATVVKEGSETE